MSYKDQVSKMSEQEFNLAIAKAIYPNAKLQVKDPDSCVYVHVIGVGWRDWINDDALAFRLMVDNKLSLLSHRSEFCVYTFGQSEMVKSENPNRAIGECFLLMQDES